MWLPIGRIKEKLAAKARKSRIKSLLEKSRFDLLLAEELFDDGKTLGSGLGGEVRVVTIDGQEYALKETIYPEGSQEEDFAKNDVHFGTKLNHPLVLRYLASHTEDAGLDESGKKQLRTRILQPLAEMDLHDALNDGHFHEPCTWPNLGKILLTFKRLVQSIEYMHSQHVVHLDLKHANVLVRNAASSDPDVLLCDFGFCIQMAGPDAEHELSSACGTDGYYAPEVVPGIWTYQRQRVSTACLKSDIYALGVMLWEMITAKQVMRKVTGADGTKVMEKDPKFPNLSGSPWSTPMSVRPGGFRVLHQLDWLIRKMTRDDHMSRPSATQVIAELTEILTTPTLEHISHPDENHCAPPPLIHPPTPILTAPATPEKDIDQHLNSRNLFSPNTTDTPSDFAVNDGGSVSTSSPMANSSGNSSPILAHLAPLPIFPPSEPVTPVHPQDNESHLPLSPRSPLPHETFPILATLFSESNKGSKDPAHNEGPSTRDSNQSSPRIAARRNTSPDSHSLISPRIKASTLWSRLTGGSSGGSSIRTPACSGSEVSPSPACSQTDGSGTSTPTSHRGGVTATA